MLPRIEITQIPISTHIETVEQTQIHGQVRALRSGESSVGYTYKTELTSSLLDDRIIA